MNWNYCPNCGQELCHTVLTCNPPISVTECTRCGWQIRDGRQPSWNTVSNGTVRTVINNPHGWIAELSEEQLAIIKSWNEKKEEKENGQ